MSGPQVMYTRCHRVMGMAEAAAAGARPTPWPPPGGDTMTPAHLPPLGQGREVPRAADAADYPPGHPLAAATGVSQKTGPTDLQPADGPQAEGQVHCWVDKW